MKRLNFYIIISLVSIAIAIIGIINSNIGSVSFIWVRSDYFMDLYNTIYSSKKKELYTELGNVYPPILMLLLKYSAGFIAHKENSFDLRNFSAPLSFGIIILCFHSIWYSLSNKLRIYKLSLIQSSALSFQLFTFPYMTFALDRMNLILVVFIITFPIIVVIEEANTNFFTRLRIASWITILIKPYFFISTLLLEILFARSVKNSIKSISFLVSIYILLNLIPFYLFYNGGILEWVENTFLHPTIMNDSISMHFNSRYYSLSPQAVLDIYPFTNFQDFSTFKTQWHNLYQIAGKIISFILTIELIRRLIILISLYRSKSNFPLREKGNEFQISLNLSLFLIFLIPLMIMLLWIPSIGFYAGILLIIPICLGYLFGNKRNRLTIHFSLIGLSAIGASYPAFFSPSFAFCILTWCFVFYSMNIVMHYINEHCLNRGQAQSNSIQLQSQDV